MVTSSFGSSNFIGNLLFLWVFKYIKLRNQPILLEIPSSQETSTLLLTLKQNWNLELSKPKPSYFKAALKTLYKEYLLSAFILTIGNGQKMILAVLVKKLVDYLIDPQKPIYEGILLTLAFVASCLTMSILKANAEFRCFLMIGKLKVLITQMLSEKILKLNRKNIDEGKIFNILSSDIEMLDLIMYSLYIICAPFLTLFAAIILYYMFDPNGLVGIGLSVMHIPVIIVIGGIGARYRKKVGEYADKRMSLVENLIEGIKIFKLYAWELSLTEIIKSVRKEEIKNKLILSLLNALLTVIAMCGVLLVIYITFYVHLMLGKELTLSKIYMATTIFFSNHINIVYMNTIAIISSMQISTILSRVGEILLIKESTELKYNPNSKYAIKVKEATFSYKRSKDHSEVIITTSNALSQESKEHSFIPSLQQLTFSLKKGEILTVIGSVGSGKSTLLLALLGEIKLRQGLLSVCGSISYACEVPWIITGSVKENILMGREYNEDAYYNTLKSCALIKDLESFSDYDETLIGERGITLSGGQRVRINLARAIYSQCEILLLDDPLSSVDSEVSSHLYNECVIKQKAQGKTVVLVTHQIQYLSQSDKILMLDKGHLIFYGSYKQLVKQNSILTNFIDDHQKQIIVDKSLKAKQERGVYDKILIEEESTEDKLQFRSIWRYFKSGYKSIFVFILSVILVGGSQVIFQLNLYWFSHRSELKDQSDSYYLSILGYFLIASYIAGSFYSFFEASLLVRCNHTLHNHAIEKLVRTKMLFFDKNPSGRVINRFSKDVSNCDEALQFYIIDSTNAGALIIGSITVTLIINPYNIIMLPFWIGVQVFLFIYLTPLIIRSRKAETISRAPILSTVNSVIEGLATIRCMKIHEKFLKDFTEFIQYNYRTYITLQSFARFAQAYTDLSAILIVGLNVITIAATKGNMDLTLAAYSLAASLFSIGISSTLSKDIIEMQIHMLCAQRLLEYEDLESEALESNTNISITNGDIVFKNISLKYRPELPLSLNNICLNINAGEKVGIIGRTGAGKSSIVHVLCRLTDPQSGTIIIDGQDYLNSGLHSLRQQISVIPQLAVLFATSIRENLDPFNKFTEHQLNRVLELVKMKGVIDEHEQGLDVLIGEKGITLSAGQRQLLCLARAVLLKNRIVLLDEATSNIDFETDQLIQKIVSKKFKGCTTLVIAHRLQTVLHSDKIIVMENGECREMGSTLELFSLGGKFHKFAVLSGVTLNDINESRKKND